MCFNVRQTSLSEEKISINILTNIKKSSSSEVKKNQEII